MTHPAGRRWRSCRICGAPAAGPYCERHARPDTTTARGLGARHQQARKDVVAQATHCSICGAAFKRGDAVEAHHIVPRALGGQSVPGNLAAAHAHCNASEGARLGTSGLIARRLRERRRSE